MSHPEFLSSADPLDHLVEECAELILALQKYKRFGPFKFSPFDPAKITNIDQVKLEMEDVNNAIERLSVQLRVVVFNEYKDNNHD